VTERAKNGFPHFVRLSRRYISPQQPPPPQPVPAVGQASHASRDTLDPAAMDTANVENAFTGFPLPQAGHFAGTSFSLRINTSNWCPHLSQLYS
jgi:hypothetical protein